MSIAMDPRKKKNKPQTSRSSAGLNDVRESPKPVLVSKELSGKQTLDQYSHTESSLRVQRIVMTITVVVPFLGLLMPVLSSFLV